MSILFEEIRTHHNVPKKTSTLRNWFSFKPLKFICLQCLFQTAFQFSTEVMGCIGSFPLSSFCSKGVNSCFFVHQVTVIVENVIHLYMVIFVASKWNCKMLLTTASYCRFFSHYLIGTGWIIVELIFLMLHIMSVIIILQKRSRNAGVGNENIYKWIPYEYFLKVMNAQDNQYWRQ